MKFTIPTKTLAEALRVVSVCITGGKSTLPILGNVKIDAQKDGLILSTTNLDIWVSNKCEAKVERGSATTVSFSLLSQLVNRMKGSQVSIQKKGNEIEFRCGDVFAKIETLDAAEFPPPLVAQSDQITQCDAEEILKPFRLLEHAVAQPDSTRYVMQGINLCSGENGTGYFVATDAKRCLSYSGSKLVKESVTVPHQFVIALLKVAPRGAVNVTVSPDAISIRSESIDMASKLIEGTFPNWRTVIPERVESAFSLRREDLIDALRTCQIFTERQMPSLTISGKGKNVEVSRPGKASVDIMGTELSGQPDIEILMNSKFLIETLSVMECENIRLECLAERSTVLFEDGPLKCVINKLIPLNK